MTEELKPCPFCGSKELVIGELKGILDGRYFVNCVKCHASGPLGGKGKDEEEGAKKCVQKWNMRKTSGQ